MDRRAVLGYEGFYEVTADGRVFGVQRRVYAGRNRTRIEPAREIKQHKNTHGYLTVRLYKLGCGATREVHKLVAEAFMGALPKGMQTRHLNGVATDNRIQNLRFGTVSENRFDSVRHGTHGMARRKTCKRGHAFDGHNGKQRTCSVCSLIHSATYRGRTRSERNS